MFVDDDVHVRAGLDWFRRISSLRVYSSSFFPFQNKAQDQELAEFDTPPPLEPVTDDDESSSSSVEDTFDDETIDVQ